MNPIFVKKFLDKMLSSSMWTNGTSPRSAASWTHLLTSFVASPWFLNLSLVLNIPILPSLYENWNLGQFNNECIIWPTCKWPSSRQVQMTGRVEIFQKLFQDWSKFSTCVQSSHQRISSCPPVDWSIVSQEVGWQYHYHLNCGLMFPYQEAGNWDTDGICDMAG